jgi:hypothetical protein
MNSPRYAAAGLLVEHARKRVMLDGGPDTALRMPLDAWLVTDDRAELMPAIRRLSRAMGLEARVGPFSANGLHIEPRPVVHTSHPTYGYLIRAENWKIVWAPEFWEFPAWARNADLMFSEAAGWNRPIRFAGGVGGHQCLLDVARQARKHKVRRLVFAHIGRPTIRAIDAGNQPPFGEFGMDGAKYVLRGYPAQQSAES